MKKILISAFLTLIVASPALAAGLVPCGGQGEPRCELCHFFVMGQGIINFVLFTIVPPLAVLLVVIGGALFIIGSSYNPSLIKQGRSIMESVAIGLVIIYGSWIFVNTFFALIGLANTQFGQRISQWFVFPCP